ncbi:MAG: hypothetical protein ACJAXA_003556 [Candidatus Aldehydirespiratoraceae bacterium]|jgi:hypothetical protein
MGGSPDAARYVFARVMSPYDQRCGDPTKTAVYR